MKILPLITSVFIGTTISTAQIPTIELKSIQKQGWRYYYDFKPVENPYALQIPIAALDDAEVSRDFNSYKTLNKIGNLAWIAPGIVLLNGDLPPERFPLIIVGTAAANLFFGILAHRKMKRAINRYNLLILEKT